MKVAVLAVGLFAAAFALHLVIWRLHLPRRQILSLLLLFCAALALGLPIVLLLLPGVFGIWQVAHALLAYTAVALAYIVLYSALEEDSPSLKLLLFLADAGPRGRSLEAICALLTVDLIVGSRFEGLVRSGLVRQSGGVYQLTRKGRFWALLFWRFRALFGMRKGG